MSRTAIGRTGPTPRAVFTTTSPLSQIAGVHALFDATGNGLISPATAPSLIDDATASTFHAGNMGIAYSYVCAAYETGRSATVNVSLTASHSAKFQQITGIPTWVTSVKVYAVTVQAGDTAGLLGTISIVTPGTIPQAIFSAQGNGATPPAAGGTASVGPDANWLTATSAPGLKVACIRVGQNVLSQDGTTWNFKFFDPWLADCNSKGVKFAIRVMCGQWTTTAYFTGGGNFYSGPAQSGTYNVLNPGDGGGFCKVPFPWAAGGGNNVAFETIFTSMMTAGQAYCLANLIPLLHLPNYAFNFSEWYFGAAVRVGDYLYARIITAHQRLLAIAYPFASAVLAVEVPLSGTGTLTSSNTVEIAPGSFGHGQVALDMSTYAATLVGSGDPGTLLVQLNGLESNPTGFTDNIRYAGSASQTTDEAHQAQAFGSGICHAAQMINPGNFDWDTMFASIKAGNGGAGNYDIKYVEVYTNTGAGGHKPDGSTYTAGQSSFSGENSASLLANILTFQPSVPAGGRAVGSPRVAA